MCGKSFEFYEVIGPEHESIHQHATHSSFPTFSYLELPQIVTKPSDTSVQVGDSALIMCQAEGRPHPDIEWIKISGAPIDLNRVRVVNGKGIRIERVELKDEGEYLCKAKNVAGSEEAKASLVITQRPFFKIKPSNRVQIPANSGKMVALECQSGGQPSPTSFWVREGQRTLIHPLSTDSGALFLSNPSLEDGGHFACIALNEVGSAMTRAQVIVYDPNNANQPKEDAIDLVEARRRFDSLQLTLTTAKALDQNSIKISWSLNDQGLNIFLSGFRVFYRKIGDVHFEMVEISHPQASSFVISRLEEYTEYQIFIMPFYQDTFGMPSRLALVQTHPHIPSSAPTITKAMVLNETTIFLAWQPLNEAAANGLLTAYEVSVKLGVESKFFVCGNRDPILSIFKTFTILGNSHCDSCIWQDFISNSRIHIRTHHVLPFNSHHTHEVVGLVFSVCPLYNSEFPDEAGVSWARPATVCI